MTNATQGVVCAGQAGVRMPASQGAAHFEATENSGPIRMATSRSFAKGSQVKLLLSDGSIMAGVVVERVPRD